MVIVPPQKTLRFVIEPETANQKPGTSFYYSALLRLCVEKGRQAAKKAAKEKSPCKVTGH
jgi:hypothetical protein